MVSNTIIVTMNQDHTVQAVFTSTSKTSSSKLAAVFLGSGAIIGIIAVGAPKKP